MRSCCGNTTGNVIELAALSHTLVPSGKVSWYLPPIGVCMVFIIWLVAGEPFTSSQFYHRHLSGSLQLPCWAMAPVWALSSKIVEPSARRQHGFVASWLYCSDQFSSLCCCCCFLTGWSQQEISTNAPSHEYDRCCITEPAPVEEMRTMHNWRGGSGLSFRVPAGYVFLFGHPVETGSPNCPSSCSAEFPADPRLSGVLQQ